MKFNIKNSLLLVILSVPLVAQESSQNINSDKLKDSVAITTSSLEEASQNQQRINKIDKETRDLEFEYIDGTKEVVRIPAELWKSNNEQVSKVFVFDNELARVTLDPFLETADVNRNNNYWPARLEPTRFQLFKDQNSRENPMQRDRRAKEKSSSMDSEQDE